MQLDIDSRMIINAFAYDDGTVDRTGIFTEKGKVYGAALARSRVDDLHPLEWDGHLFDGIRTG